MVFVKDVNRFKHLYLNHRSMMKPPNILLKTSKENFAKQQKLINSLVKQHCYTIYHLNDEKFHRQPWRNACVLLLYEYNQSVICNEELKILGSYLNNHSGKLLLHGDTVCDENSLSSLMENMNLDVNISQTVANDFMMNFGETIESSFKLHLSVFKRKLTDTPVSQLADVLHDLGIEVGRHDEYNEMSLPAYFYSVDSNNIEKVFNFQHTSNEISGDKLKICFIEGNESRQSLGNDIISTDNQPSDSISNDSDDVSVTNQSHNCLTYDNQSDNRNSNGNHSDKVILNVSCQYPLSSSFDWELYKSKIKTKRYGKNLIYKDTIESTHDVFTKLSTGAIKSDGLVVIAAQQMKGRGRSGNQWLSPLGCMMFSMQIAIPLQSLLGQRLSLIQHIVVVAFVKSIKERRGYEKLDINIKWPNDVYIKGYCKIGGIIVNSSLFDGMFRVAIGFGVNISNDEPTECLNHLIRQHNINSDLKLEELCIEDVLAGTLNRVEYLVDGFQRDGVERFKEDYYSCWMHSGTEVTIESESNAKACVQGIDDFGYLEVKMHDGRIVTLQPDGNTFDMMRNMITLKK